MCGKKPDWLRDFGFLQVALIKKGAILRLELPKSGGFSLDFLIKSRTHE